VAFAAALLVWRREAREHRGAHPPWQQLVPHVLASITPLAAINLAWWLCARRGLVDPGPTIFWW
jgi:hypothetical protein